MSSKYGSLMDEFAQWGTNIKFNTALEEWMEDHCEGFEDAEFGKEQKLEWTSVYHSYVEWLEDQLSSFCKSQGCTAEEVFEKLKECMKSEESEFMPTFMQNSEYKFFLEQMSHFANERRVKRATQKSERAKSSCVNFSGHWVVDTSFKKVHQESAEEFMEVTGCPWIYRKIFRHAASSKYLNLYIEQDDDRSIRFVYRFKFFGGSDLTLEFDKENEHKNLWNEMITSKLWIDHDKGTIEGVGVKYPKKFPKGAKGSAQWRMGRDEDTLVYKQTVVLKNGKEYTHEQHFVRVLDDTRSSK